MGPYLAKRIAIFWATLLGASVLTFVALEVLPGDPARVILGIDAPDSAVAALRAELGLDRPAAARYIAWIGRLAQGDLGTSYTYGVPVAELIAERLEITLPLAFISMALTIAIALVLGTYAAARHNRAGDLAIMTFGQLGIAVPNFWLGLLLILLFSVHLGWFSAGGFPGWQAGPMAALKALVLPSIALATVQAAILARITRSAVLDCLGEDYVRTARAKGLSRRATLIKHVLRNASIPVVTIMGLQFANLLAGTIIVENVFNLPGLGRLLFQAIGNRDLVVVRDVVLMLAAMVVALNFAVDLAYGLLDPRLRTRTS